MYIPGCRGDIQNYPLKCEKDNIKASYDKYEKNSSLLIYNVWAGIDFFVHMSLIGNMLYWGKREFHTVQGLSGVADYTI